MDETREASRQPRQRKTVSGGRLRLLRYLLAAAAMLLAANIFFEISDIQVKGNVIYSEGEIREASGLQVGDSGLLAGIKLLDGIKGVTTIRFRTEDIVRHPLVTKIVKAFDKKAGPETEPAE